MIAHPKAHKALWPLWIPWIVFSLTLAGGCQDDESPGDETEVGDTGAGQGADGSGDAQDDPSTDVAADTRPADAGPDTGDTGGGTGDADGDSGAEEAGSDADTRAEDSGGADASSDGDAGTPDTGTPDTSTTDTSGPDTGSEDTGTDEEEVGGPLLPDLTLLEPEDDPWLTQREFDADECVVEDACVNAPGVRRLLMFDTVTGNYGPADVDIGIPGVSDAFHFSACYERYVVTDHIIQHELRSADGTVVATGHKQADCLADWNDFLPESSPTGGRYHCNRQGISWGWYDFYGTHLECQWIDVTAVPAGAYTLFVEINRSRVFEETNYDNNTLEIPVVIPALQLDESCSGDTDFNGPGRNCEWAAALTESCTTGSSVRVGCNTGEGCDLGDSCSGDPMIRVCDGADPHCSIDRALAWSDDACDSNCPFAEFTCPASGLYRVWTAPFREDSAYSCELGFFEELL